MLTRRGLFLGGMGAVVAAPTLIPQEAFAQLPIVTVSPQGHQVRVGAFPSGYLEGWQDPDVLYWSARHLHDDWKPTVHNEAGWWTSPYKITSPDVRLDHDGTLLIRNEHGWWRMTYIGPPFIYSFRFTGKV